jgi:hypothetical protein
LLLGCSNYSSFINDSKEILSASVLQNWIRLATCLSNSSSDLVVADHDSHITLALQKEDFSIAPRRISTWQSHLRTLNKYQGIGLCEWEYELDYRQRIVEAVRTLALPRASPD